MSNLITLLAVNKAIRLEYGVGRLLTEGKIIRIRFLYPLSNNHLRS